MLSKFRIKNHELRIMVFVLSIILASLFIIHPVYAQTTPASTSKESVQSTVYSLPSIVSPTSPLYTDLLVNNMFHTFSCLAIGQSFIGQPCLTYQITQNAQGAIQSVPILSQVNLSGGTLGAITSAIGLLYLNPPVRTADYLASLGQGLGVGKVAHAQVTGSGATVLKPILTLWQVSRNISYVIMIIIFVVIGLMIMFRNKLNPQTVITAQTALPGLVIGLILITFSYFLAGLISDMAFVGTNVVGYYFAAAQGKTDDPQITNLVNTISSKNVLNIFGPLTGIVGSDKVSGFLDSIVGQLPGNVQFTLRTIVAFMVAQFFAPIAGGIGAIGQATPLGSWGFMLGPVATLFSGLVGFTAPTFTLGLALSFVASLALIYAMIKLLLRLVSSFLTIIFLTIAAPFQFLFASLPGRQGLATGWILNMLANILVFPAVLAVFYFVAFILGPDIVGKDYILKVSYLNRTENNSFIPIVSAQATGGQLIKNDTFPLFGGLDLSFISILLAFGALMALPKIPDIVVSAIGRMGQAGQLLGQEIGAGIRGGQGYAGRFQGAVGTTGSTLRQGVFGEMQYQWDKDEKRWKPYYGKPGIILLRGQAKKPEIPGGGVR